MTDSTVCATLREAINMTAVRARMPMKALAPELGWSPQELSMRTTLGGDSARSFPADDEHLVRIMQVTQDFSILATLADLCGFEIRAKESRMPEVIAGLQAELARMMPRFQMVMEWKAAQTADAGGKKAGR